MGKGPSRRGGAVGDGDLRDGTRWWQCCFAGDGEDPDVGSPAEPCWYAQQDLTEEEEEEEEEQGSSEEDERPEGPWGTESDGDPHAETPLKAPGTTTDGGGTSGPSDSSPIPTTPPRQRRGWGRARDPNQSPQTPQQPKPSWLSPSPRRRTDTKKPKDPTDICPYGRGRLNHPLPDLSKVEARVKVGQSYRPPPSRALPARSRPHGGPLVPKSPAEIVREVLLSSGEGAPPRPSAPPGVPQELRSPRQATALVQQLQVTPGLDWDARNPRGMVVSPSRDALVPPFVAYAHT